MGCFGCSLLVMEGKVGFVDYPLHVIEGDVGFVGYPLLVI